jgi:acetate kinase
MTRPEPRVLALNAGSSSVKFALFAVRGGVVPVLRGAVERIGLSDARLRISESGGAERVEDVAAPDHRAGARLILQRLKSEHGGENLAAIGHRIVHGGPAYHAPERVSARMLDDLRGLSYFDEEHLPAEIRLIEAFQQAFSNPTQIACFDTDFHWQLPRVARLLPIPRRYEAQGVRRYGFHGLSYAYLTGELARLAGTPVAPGRIVLAHLGNGASLAAVRDGTPVDTSMAFTPAAGIPMSTRSGDLDPGLSWYLARTEGMTAQQFDAMVNFHSGLLGVSETSSDMGDLIGREAQDPRAQDAIAMFCYRAKQTLGAFVAALGGLDTLVFAGGIGEHAPQIRARICQGLECFGIVLDGGRNATNAELISAAGSPVAVRVMHTDEERMIAEIVCRVLNLDAERRSAP